MILTMIVAAAENGVIGSTDRPIPWTIPSDVRRYQRTIAGKPVIVGRRTFDLLDAPLDVESLVILSRDPSLERHGATVAGSIPEALGFLADRAEIFVIGGADVYRQFSPTADRLHLTLVHASPVGNALFTFRPSDWLDVRPREFHEADTENEHAYTYLTLGRPGGRESPITEPGAQSPESGQ